MPPNIVTDSLVLHLHASRANSGTSPPSNSPSTSSWYNLANSSNNASLTNFGYTTSSGWAGAGTPSDPYRLVGDGSNDYCTITTNSTYNAISTNFTIGLWLKGTRSATTEQLFNKCLTVGTTKGFGLLLRSTQPYIRLWAYDTALRSTSTNQTDPRDGNWHYLVGVKEGNSLKLYVDNSNTASETPTIGDITNTNNIRIFTDPNNATPQNFFGGSINSIQLYNKALSTTEITQNYNAGMQWVEQCTGAMSILVPVSLSGSLVTSGVTHEGTGTSTAHLTSQANPTSQTVISASGKGQSSGTAQTGTTHQGTVATQANTTNTSSSRVLRMASMSASSTSYTGVYTALILEAQTTGIAISSGQAQLQNLIHPSLSASIGASASLATESFKPISASGIGTSSGGANSFRLINNSLRAQINTFNQTSPVWVFRGSVDISSGLGTHAYPVLAKHASMDLTVALECTLSGDIARYQLASISAQSSSNTSARLTKTHLVCSYTGPKKAWASIRRRQRE